MPESEDNFKITNTEYFKAIKFRARTKSFKVFDNTGPDDAIAVLSNIFEYSDNVVSLYTLNKRPDVTNNSYYGSMIEKFIFKGGRINLITQNEISDNPPLIYKIIKNYSKIKPNKIRIKTSNETFNNRIKQLFNTDKLYNFCVGDMTSVRIELNPDTFQARCTFNNSEAGEKLHNIVVDYFDE